MEKTRERKKEGMKEGTGEIIFRIPDYIPLELM